jgi:hypothetical protein
LLRLNPINVFSIAVISIAAYVIFFGGLRVTGLSLPYVNA